MPPRPRKPPHIHQGRNAILPKRPKKSLDRQRRVSDRHHFHSSLKNKDQKSGINSDSKTHHAKHHNSPSNHHNFTTKNHHKNTIFRKTPCKNAPPPQTKKMQKNRTRQKARPCFSIRSYPRISAVDLHASVNNLFPDNLIHHLLPGSLGQSHRQHIFNPRSAGGASTFST